MGEEDGESWLPEEKGWASQPSIPGEARPLSGMLSPILPFPYLGCRLCLIS